MPRSPRELQISREAKICRWIAVIRRAPDLSAQQSCVSRAKESVTPLRCCSSASRSGRVAHGRARESDEAPHLISLVVRYPFTLPLATAHVHPCAVSTPQRRSAVTPTPPAAQPLKNHARDLLEAQLLPPLQCERADGDSSNRSDLLTPLQCERTDGDSSSRSNLSHRPTALPLC